MGRRSNIGPGIRNRLAAIHCRFVDYSRWPPHSIFFYRYCNKCWRQMRYAHTPATNDTHILCLSFSNIGLLNDLWAFANMNGTYVNLQHLSVCQPPVLLFPLTHTHGRGEVPRMAVCTSHSHINHIILIFITSVKLCDKIYYMHLIHSGFSFTHTASCWCFAGVYL